MPKQCFTCGKEFYDKSGLNRHLRERHSGEPRTLFGCPASCRDVVSVRRDYIVKHITQYHPEMVNTYTGTSPLLAIPVITKKVEIKERQQKETGSQEKEQNTEKRVTEEKNQKEEDTRQIISASVVISDLGLDLSDSDEEDKTKRRTKFPVERPRPADQPKKKLHMPSEERKEKPFDKKLVSHPERPKPVERPRPAEQPKEKLHMPSEERIGKPFDKKLVSHPERPKPKFHPRLALKERKRKTPEIPFNPIKISKLEDPRQKPRCDHGGRSAVSVDYIVEGNFKSLKVEVNCPGCVTPDFISELKKMFKD